MARDVPLKCACGKLFGTALDVGPKTGCRVVCYCNDCQGFARFLGRADILNEWGGTDIFQLPPSRVHLTSGVEALSCVRLSEKGLYRWYCGNCRTPVGNSAGYKVPFIGLIHDFMDHASDGRARDDVLGKPVGHVLTQSANASLPRELRESPTWRVMVKAVSHLGKWWITGAGSPSPFFDANGVPRVTPRVLTAEERAQSAR